MLINRLKLYNGKLISRNDLLHSDTLVGADKKPTKPIKIKTVNNVKIYEFLFKPNKLNIKNIFIPEIDLIHLDTFYATAKFNMEININFKNYLSLLEMNEMSGLRFMASKKARFEEYLLEVSSFKEVGHENVVMFTLDNNGLYLNGDDIICHSWKDLEA